MTTGKAICVVGLATVAVVSEVNGQDGSGWGVLAVLVLLLA